MNLYVEKSTSGEWARQGAARGRSPASQASRGIPFAAPPLGANRWRAPQPATNWEGVFHAFEFASISLQAPTGVNKDDIYTREWAVDPEIPMDEDCLYLNVWTPACDPGEKLPVFVWYFRRRPSGRKHSGNGV